MNLCSDYVVSGNITIWDNVGATDFFTYMDAVLLVGKAGSYSEMFNLLEKDQVKTYIWAAGYAFDPDYFGKNFDYFPSEKITEVVDQCVAYVSAGRNLAESQEYLETYIAQMMDDYEDKYSKKMEVLWDW